MERDGIRGDRAAAVFVRAGHPRREKTYRGKEHHLLHTLESVEAAQGVARKNGVDLEKSIERCVTITYDVDSGNQDGNVLRSLALKRNNILGIYCEVVRPGHLKLGDSLSIDGLPASFAK